MGTEGMLLQMDARSLLLARSWSYSRNTDNNGTKQRWGKEGHATEAGEKAAAARAHTEGRRRRRRGEAQRGAGPEKTRPEGREERGRAVVWHSRPNRRRRRARPTHAPASAHPDVSRKGGPERAASGGGVFNDCFDPKDDEDADGATAPEQASFEGAPALEDLHSKLSQTRRMPKRGNEDQVQSSAEKSLEPSQGCRDVERYSESQDYWDYTETNSAGQVDCPDVCSSVLIGTSEEPLGVNLAGWLQRVAWIQAKSGEA
ncbi:hypothetical protein EI555_011232, partial [Monodon monoceros]